MSHKIYLSQIIKKSFLLSSKLKRDPYVFLPDNPSPQHLQELQEIIKSMVTHYFSIDKKLLSRLKSKKLAQRSKIPTPQGFVVGQYFGLKP
jgi:hypothetical protein